jgi:hypothetical protein
LVLVAWLYDIGYSPDLVKASARRGMRGCNATGTHPKASARFGGSRGLPTDQPSALAGRHERIDVKTVIDYWTGSGVASSSSLVTAVLC